MEQRICLLSLDDNKLGGLYVVKIKICRSGKKIIE